MEVDDGVGTLLLTLRRLERGRQADRFLARRSSAGIERYLTWLGEPTAPPTLAPARGPPFFKSVVIRRKLGEPVQAELFDAH